MRLRNRSSIMAEDDQEHWQIQAWADRAPNDQKYGKGLFMAVRSRLPGTRCNHILNP